MLLLLGDGTRVAVSELPGEGPWTFLVLQPGPPEPGGVARALTRFGRAVVPDLRGRPGWGQPAGGPGFLELVDDLDQVRTRAGLGRPVLVGLGELVPLALRAAADQPWAWRALVLAPAGTPASPEVSASGDIPASPEASASPPIPSSRAAPPTGGLDGLDVPALVLDPDLASAAGTAALEGLLGRLGGGPGWAGIAPDAPPR